jgi:GT2 family glycosyltransferase
MTVPSIGVVIVNWNSREDVLAGIRSLRQEADPHTDEIVVVDNGSSDGSAEAIRAEFPAVRVIETGRNLGFAEGCNRGIEVTRSEWVFLFNNDAVAEPGCVAELRRVAASAPPDVGMLQPLIVFTALPTHVNSTGVIVFSNGRARDRHFAEPVTGAESAGDPFCPTAGAALYRRSMLERVRLDGGYLDRSFFMYFEDVDLGWRCRLAGYRAVYVPRARVRHKFQGSSKRLGSSFVATQCRVNRIATLLHNASLRFVLGSWRVTLHDLLRAARSASGLRAILRLLRRLPDVFRNRVRIARFSRTCRRDVERTWLASPPVAAPPLELPDRDA